MENKGDTDLSWRKAVHTNYTLLVSKMRRRVGTSNALGYDQGSSISSGYTSQSNVPRIRTWISQGSITGCRIEMWLGCFLNVGRRCARSPSDKEHSKKGCTTSVEEGDHLMKCGFLEVSIEDGGADDCREIEQNKLGWHNYLKKGTLSDAMHWLLSVVLTLLSKRINARLRYLIWPTPVPINTCSTTF